MIKKTSYALLLSFTCCLAVLGLIAGQEDNSGIPPVAVYLTWQKCPESTMTVHWITTVDTQNDTLVYRLDGQDDWKPAGGMHVTLPSNTPYFLHTIELTNLAPGTTYQFVLPTDGRAYKFSTMPATLDKPIRFVAGGDMYHDTLEILHETNKQAAKTNPLFALVGGDIAYASDKKVSFLPRWTHPYIDKMVGQKAERWMAWLKAWTDDMVTTDGRLIPMIPAIGNHDTTGRFDQTPNEAPFFYTLFPFPGTEGCNVLDFSNYMSIIVLDSNHTHPIGGRQAEWLASALKARQQVPHKFALYHIPAFPCVHHFKNDLGTEIRKHWVPSFDAYGLTAAFENHEHAYKRTYPLKDGYINPAGVVYLGDGGWGVDKPRKPRHLVQKKYIAKTAPARHFIVVDVEPGQRTVNAIDSKGNVIDTFSWSSPQKATP